MPDARYLYAAYGLTWLVLIAFTVATMRRLRRAERAARAVPREQL